MNILVVDDEKYIRQGLKSMIEYNSPRQVNVEVAKDGLEAMEYLDRQYFNMIFTDINMPNMNGIDLIKHIGSIIPRPVVIIISGYNDFNYVVEALRNNVVDYLLKPIDRKDIKALLERYGSHEQQDEVTVSRTHEREILGRDIKCALLDPGFTPDNDETLCRKVRRFLGAGAAQGASAAQATDSIHVVCMHINSIFMRATIENQLNNPDVSDCIYINNVLGNDYVFAEKIPEFIRNSALMEKHALWAGVSSVDNRLISACTRAESMMKHAFLTGEGFSRYQRPLCPVPEIDQAEITRLVYHVDEGRVEDARLALLDKFSVIRIPEYPPEFFEQYIGSFLTMLEKIYPEACGKYHAIKVKLQDIYHFSCLLAYFQELFGYLYIISNEIRSSLQSRYRLSLDSAIEFVDRNYQRDINLAVVANHVGINYSVLSKEFKDYTGKNFVNYIKEKRIAKACEMLVSTNLRSSGIAASIGFINDKQFAKVFKSIVGITPSEYRKLHSR